jgi:hypothetical protein
MNRTTSLFFLLSLVALLLGCSKQGKTGVYLGAEDSSIEIKPDGSFYISNIRFRNGSFEAEDSPRKGGGLQLVGKYQWEEGGITFVFEGGRAVRGQVRGDTLSVGTRSEQIWIYSGKLNKQ